MKTVYEDIEINITSADKKQWFIIVSNLKPNSNTETIAEKMYEKIKDILNEYKLTIFHERIFGSIKQCGIVEEIRKRFLENENYSYLDGAPYWGEGISGVILHAVRFEEEDELVNLDENGVWGCIWKSNAADYIMLHSVRGNCTEDYYSQTKQMFENAYDILNKYGFSFNNVIRTWIYINEILLQYNEFNRARNEIFTKYGLLKTDREENPEDIFLPASTGIGCNNIFGCSAVTDFFAVKIKDSSKVKIVVETGKGQKSAYRYGSAFSRSIVLSCEGVNYIYLSGTASINDKGETVYQDDIEGQIEKTFSVIDGLIKTYNAELRNVCEGIVFIKNENYYEDFIKFTEKNQLTLPTFCVKADVCRDDLLFEMDAILIAENL